MLVREAMLFAAVGLLIGGVDDLAVDLIYLVRRWRRRRLRRATLATLPPVAGGRLVVFVPAWDEVTVIGPMLRTALARWGAADVRILVGTYPNDPATTAAAGAVAAIDPRVRVVVGPRPGPTTKADCLNVLWRALAAEAPASAVIVHDAEDVVHAAELDVFARLIGRHDVVQLPVEPLIDPGARFVSGCVADEFAESHGKTMVVRGAIGAGMPLAGTGCALSVDLLRRLAAQRGGDPFDADSWVEDYELGLRIAALGGRGIFARIDDGAGGVVAVRSLFPGRIAAAVRQKARWTAGIALSGWDRTGWTPRRLALADHWMRARDRRAPLAALVLAVAWGTVLAWSASAGLHAWHGVPQPAYAPAWLIAVTTLLLVWRAAVRAAFSGRTHGWRQGLLALPRMVVGNWISLLSTPVALQRYLRLLRGRRVGWDKTAHRFPPPEPQPA